MGNGCFEVVKVRDGMCWGLWGIFLKSSLQSSSVIKNKEESCSRTQWGLTACSFMHGLWGVQGLGPQCPIFALGASQDFQRTMPSARMVRFAFNKRGGDEASYFPLVKVCLGIH